MSNTNNGNSWKVKQCSKITHSFGKVSPIIVDKGLNCPVFLVNVRKLPFHAFNTNLLNVYHVPRMQEILRKLIQAFDLEELIIQ